jgi:hypothetical protein
VTELSLFEWSWESAFRKPPVKEPKTDKPLTLADITRAEFKNMSNWSSELDDLYSKRVGPRREGFSNIEHAEMMVRVISLFLAGKSLERRSHKVQETSWLQRLIKITGACPHGAKCVEKPGYALCTASTHSDHLSGMAESIRRRRVSASECLCSHVRDLMQAANMEKLVEYVNAYNVLLKKESTSEVSDA